MKKPLIALTPQYNQDTNRTWMRPEYTDAILKSGGIPVLLEQYSDPEVIAEICDVLDGVLFTGGDDVHPKYYGEEVLPECGEITEKRDIFELALYAEAVRRDMPIFGICRGIQLIAVGAGGTLYQHVPAHSAVRHDVEITRGTLFHDIIGADVINTNSYHHQAVKTTGPRMIAAAYSNVEESGRLIEAIYDPSARFNASVQWHPENMYNDDEHSRKLFAAFVSACAGYKADKV